MTSPSSSSSSTSSASTPSTSASTPSTPSSPTPPLGSPPSPPPMPLSPPSQPLTPLTPLHSLTTLADRSTIVSEATLQIARHLCATLAGGTLAQFAEFHSPTDMLSAYEHQTALDETGAYDKLLSLLGANVDVMVLSILEGLCIDLVHTNCRNLVDKLLSLLSQPDNILATLRTLCWLLHNDHCRCNVVPRSILVTTITQTLEHNRENDEVVAHGIRVLAMCCMNSRANQTHVASRALGVVLTVARGRTRLIKLMTCALIRNVGVGRADLIERLDKLACVEYALDCVASGICSVVQHGLAALFHLIHPPPPPPRPGYTPPPARSYAAPRDSPYTITAVRMLGHGQWEEMLCDTARRYSSKAGIQALIYALSTRMAVVGGGLVCRKLVKVDMVRLCLKAVNRHINKRHMVYYGARFVRVVLEGGGGMEQLREWGGVDRLLDMLYCTVVSDVRGGKGEWEGSVDVFDDGALVM